MSSKISLTPLEDAVRERAATTPKPKNEMERAITACLEVFYLENAKLMDRGCQPDELFQLASSVIASIADGVSLNVCENIEEYKQFTPIKVATAILGQSLNTIQAQKPFRVDTFKNNSPRHGRA